MFNKNGQATLNFLFLVGALVVTLVVAFRQQTFPGFPEGLGIVAKVAMFFTFVMWFVALLTVFRCVCGCVVRFLFF